MSSRTIITLTSISLGSCWIHVFARNAVGLDIILTPDTCRACSFDTSTPTKFASWASSASCRATTGSILAYCTRFHGISSCWAVVILQAASSSRWGWSSWTEIARSALGSIIGKSRRSTVGACSTQNAFWWSFGAFIRQEIRRSACRSLGWLLNTIMSFRAYVTSCRSNSRLT